jgi:hypothetical protein
MKKLVIALAVTGLAGSAWPQSNQMPPNQMLTGPGNSQVAGRVRQMRHAFDEA